MTIYFKQVMLDSYFQILHKLKAIRGVTLCSLNIDYIHLVPSSMDRLGVSPSALWTQICTIPCSSAKQMLSSLTRRRCSFPISPLCSCSYCLSCSPRDTFFSIMSWFCFPNWKNKLRWIKQSINIQNSLEYWDYRYITCIAIVGKHARRGQRQNNYYSFSIEKIRKKTDEEPFWRTSYYYILHKNKMRRFLTSKFINGIE